MTIIADDIRPDDFTTFEVVDDYGMAVDVRPFFEAARDKAATVAARVIGTNGRNGERPHWLWAPPLQGREGRLVPTNIRTGGPVFEIASRDLRVGDTLLWGNMPVTITNVHAISGQVTFDGPAPQDRGRTESMGFHVKVMVSAS